MTQEAKVALSVPRPAEAQHDALEPDLPVAAIANAQRERRRIAVIGALDLDLEATPLQRAPARREVVGRALGVAGFAGTDPDTKLERFDSTTRYAGRPFGERAYHRVRI
jgi:hypothetical protein